jgi:CoA:oxalate CoA-transferase
MAGSRSDSLPLAGLRVVELGDGVAPAFAGRWLAAFGAEVLTIEPPEGHWARRYGPSGGVWDDGAAPLSTYLFAGKQSLCLDLSSGVGRDVLRSVIRDADLLVHDQTPERFRQNRLEAELLRGWFPSLIQLALLPFGSSGPYASYQASPITLLALGGYQFLTGEPGRPPLMLPGFQAEYMTAMHGLSAALAALLRRLASGTGAAVEISAIEALAALHQFTISQYLTQGTIRSRHGNRWENLYPITMLPCRDGYLAFSLPSQDMWERLCAMLGRPDLLEDHGFFRPCSGASTPTRSMQSCSNGCASGTWSKRSKRRRSTGAYRSTASTSSMKCCATRST